MQTNSLEAIVRKLASPLVTAIGLDIWGVEVETAGRKLVRVYIDSVTIAQCEEISRQLGLSLDVADAVQGAYVLEVSSPGLSRRFFELDQMRAYLGDVVKVSLYTATAPEDRDARVNPRKVWQGTLEAVSESAFVIAPVTISYDGEIIPEPFPQIHVEWSNVRNAKLIHVFRKPVRPGKKNTGH